MGDPRWKDLDEFLFARAMGQEPLKLLFRLACEYLLSSRVVRPGVILLLRQVAAARARARTETWSRVRHLLTERRCAELDLLLVPDAHLGRTLLAWLASGRRRRARPLWPSAETFQSGRLAETAAYSGPRATGPRARRSRMSVRSG